jgi:hypothetical protein
MREDVTQLFQRVCLSCERRRGNRTHFDMDDFLPPLLRGLEKLCSSYVPLTVLLICGISISVAMPRHHVFASDADRTLESKIAGTDWSNIRGANFIPSYASNTYEIWRDYDHDAFENELRLVSSVGYNSVRLWLNYDAFVELGGTMVDRVEDALRLCAKYHLRAEIVLFDSCGVRPHQDLKWITAKDAYDQYQSSSRFTPEQKAFMAHLFHDYAHGFGARTLVPVGASTPFMTLLWQNWQSTPGNDRLGPEWYPQLEKYVDAIVERMKNNPNVLLWDLMNEPEFASEGPLSATLLIAPEMEKVRDAFLVHFHDYLKRRFPNEIGTVGWARLDDAEKHSDLSDVITFHVYGDAAALGREIEKAQAFSVVARKKILITETLANWDFGKPSFGAMATDEAQLAHYEEVLPILMKSPIGWIGWGMVISRDFDPYTDIFYPNGIPRPAATFLEKTLLKAAPTP